MKINIATSHHIDRVIRLTTNQDWDHLKQVIFQHLRRNNYPSALINRILCRCHPTAQNNTTIGHPPPNQLEPLPISPTTAAELPTASSTTTSPARHQQRSSSDHPNQPTPTPPETANPNTDENLQSTHQNSPPPIEIFYRSVPFIPQLTNNIAHSLKRDFPQVKLAYRTIKTTRSILKQVKDPVPKQQQSNVIYSIPCEDCDKTYIGMTRNQLKTRLSGHQTHINKHQRLIETNTTQTNIEIDRLKETTALMKHVIEEEHKFDLTKTSILDQARRATALPILEMCHLSTHTNTVNYRTDVDNLNTTYSGILHTIKNHKSRKRNQNDENSNTQHTTQG